MKYNDSGYVIMPQTVISAEPTFYVPDGVERLRVIPFDYVKIARAGKHIAAKFAARYYNSGSYGLHIIPSESIQVLNDHDVNVVFANYLDNSLFLAPQTTLTVTSRLSDFDKAIEKCSEFTSLRTGDIICLEHPDLHQVTIDRNASLDFDAVYKSLTIKCL